MIPGGAGGGPVKPPDTTNEYIRNPHFGKEYLTLFEAIDAINMLSGMIMADLRYREGVKDQRRTG